MGIQKPLISNVVGAQFDAVFDDEGPSSRVNITTANSSEDTVVLISSDEDEAETGAVGLIRVKNERDIKQKNLTALLEYEFFVCLLLLCLVLFFNISFFYRVIVLDDD